jgi:redox-sensitive bicupin YhaK (pirin superfamily)
MQQIRRSHERGHAHHGWLDSRFSFSFAEYHDPEHMGFRSLRVINEDHVSPDSGFPTHPHREMEIITYVISGALTHRDSMGNEEALRAGMVQRMSAGTGITHSEYNASPDEPLHLLQIWILPGESGLAPSYEDKEFPLDQRRNELRLLGSRDARDGSVKIHQDVDLYGGLFEDGKSHSFELGANRHAWIQVVRGGLKVNGHALEAGDAVAVRDEPRLDLKSTGETEFLLFDLG